MMRIVLDAMGGDYAPQVPVEGAVMAVKDFDDIHVILVGIEDQVNAELAKYEYPKDRISVVHASELIDMNESPATAIRQKKDSSIVVGTTLVKKGEAEGFVSAGSTGACMAASLLKIGRVEGVKRPPIATVFPNVKNETVVLDAGANVDIGPEELVQFAIMGSIFAEKILKKKNPKVGLLNIGEEEHKGSKLTHETFPLLQKAPINFIGNVEGRDIFKGGIDVVVCDGFVGNIVLKTTEGVADAIFTILKEEIMRSATGKMGALLLKSAFRGLKKRMDYTEYGGAPLLGLKGISIISHGSSNAWAIRNALRIARETLINNLIGVIAENMIRGEMTDDQN